MSKKNRINRLIKQHRKRLKKAVKAEGHNPRRIGKNRRCDNTLVGSIDATKLGVTL